MVGQPQKGNMRVMETLERGEREGNRAVFEAVTTAAL